MRPVHVVVVMKSRSVGAHPAAASARRAAASPISSAPRQKRSSSSTVSARRRFGIEIEIATLAVAVTKNPAAPTSV